MAAEPRVGIFLAGYGDGGAKGREMRRAASTSATTNTRAAPKNAAPGTTSGVALDTKKPNSPAQKGAAGFALGQSQRLTLAA